jgi:hypothetical protein
MRTNDRNARSKRCDETGYTAPRNFSCMFDRVSIRHVGVPYAEHGWAKFKSSRRVGYKLDTPPRRDVMLVLQSVGSSPVS